jgi:hypothetical protein
MSDAVDEPPSPIFRPCKATRWQKQVAEVAKALCRRTDELAVLLARAIPRRSWSSALMWRLSARRRCRLRARCAASMCVLRGWAGPYNDLHCSGSSANGRQDTRGAFNRPI